MSCGETTEDLHTSVGELTILMNDTFTCCMRNYEALLPYLEKNETKPKIYNKLVQVNILLNKLNEELVGLRVEYVTVSSYQQKRETVLSEGSRKRRTSDVSEVGRRETKSVKTEMPFSNTTKCSVTLVSETGVNMQSDSFLAIDIERTKHAQVQKLDVLCTKNIKSEIQDLDDVVDALEFTKGNSDILAAQTLCDTINNGMTVHVAGSDKIASMGDKLVGGNLYNKSADEDFFPLQNVESEASNGEKCEDNVFSKDKDIDSGLQGEVLATSSLSYQAKRAFSGKETPVAFTKCDKESAKMVERIENSRNREARRGPQSPERDVKDDVHVQRSDEVCSVEIDTYGIVRHKKRQFKCTLCNCVLHSKYALYSHVQGKKHKKKLITAKNSSCAKKLEVSNKSCTSTASTISVSSAVTSSLEDTVLSNRGESAASVSPCSADASSHTDTVPTNSGESTSFSVCSDISCSLADTVAIVENTHQVISLKHAIRLDDIWTYFHAPFHINKKFFRIHSGKVVCSLCNEKLGKYLLDVKTHISKLSHLDRINVLQKLELAGRSSKKRLLNIPGILQNIIPRSQFSLRNNGFCCSVCQCYCENTVVLKHMTSANHVKNLEEMKEFSVDKISVTIRKSELDLGRKKRVRTASHKGCEKVSSTTLC